MRRGISGEMHPAEGTATPHIQHQITKFLPIYVAQ